MKGRVCFLSLLLWIAVLAAPAAAEEPKQAEWDKKLHKLLKHTVPLITPGELTEALGGPAPPLLLDTRKREEFTVSHLKNARFTGYKKFRLSVLDDISKETPIVVYCSLGVRSERIGEKLRRAGYGNVKNLFGGLFEWVNRGYTVYDAQGRSTPRVHAFSKAWAEWLLKGEKVL